MALAAPLLYQTLGRDLRVTGWYANGSVHKYVCWLLWHSKKIRLRNKISGDTTNSFSGCQNNICPGAYPGRGLKGLDQFTNITLRCRISGFGCQSSLRYNIASQGKQMACYFLYPNHLLRTDIRRAGSAPSGIRISGMGCFQIRLRSGYYIL